jgi:uncharacterized protein YjbJ (UPF0337 family)
VRLDSVAVTLEGVLPLGGACLCGGVVNQREKIMGMDDKASNEATDLKGKAKESAGKVTGNESLESEGKADQGEAKVKKAGQHVKDAADNIKDTFKS